MKAEVILASQCGASLGKYILTVERNPVDLDYSRKVTENKLRTSSPIYLYSIKPQLVEKAEIVNTANNGKFVEYNSDSTLRIPLISGESIDKIIPKPSAESVRTAILKFETSKQKTIFIDYPTLTKEVAALNAESEAILTNFINDLMKHVKTLKDATAAEILACKNAMEDEGIDVSSILG